MTTTACGVFSTVPPDIRIGACVCTPFTVKDMIHVFSVCSLESYHLGQHVNTALGTVLSQEMVKFVTLLSPEKAVRMRDP